MRNSRRLSAKLTSPDLKSPNQVAAENRGRGLGDVWGKVTATAGVSWDTSQDVDSLFHFPSASCFHITNNLLTSLPLALTVCRNPACMSWAWPVFAFFLYHPVLTIAVSSQERIPTCCPAVDAIRDKASGRTQTVSSVSMNKTILPHSPSFRLRYPFSFLSFSCKERNRMDSGAHQNLQI